MCVDFGFLLRRPEDWYDTEPAAGQVHPATGLPYGFFSDAEAAGAQLQGLEAG